MIIEPVEKGKLNSILHRFAEPPFRKGAIVGRRIRPYIGILALVLFIGTVSAMDLSGLDMLRGMIRCAVLLGVAAWGSL